MTAPPQETREKSETEEGRDYSRYCYVWQRIDKVLLIEKAGGEKYMHGRCCIFAIRESSRHYWLGRHTELEAVEISVDVRWVDDF